MNGLVKPFVPNSHKSFLAACSSYNESGRYYTYTWNNSADIPGPVHQNPGPGTQLLPEEFGWPGFLEHYRLARTEHSYSASAFESADSVLIVK